MKGTIIYEVGPKSIPPVFLFARQKVEVTSVGHENEQ